MRCVGTWNPSEATAERRRTGAQAHLAALEAGYTLFDTADIYCRGVCEEVLGEALRRSASMRRQIVIATKCGIRFAGDPAPDSPHRFDFSSDYIVQSCEASLRRMGIETIDLYQLHRPDVLMNPSEVAGAFEQLQRAGKVRFFGVSNFQPSTLAALQSHLSIPLIVNQVEIHLGRLACFEDGTLDQCVERNIAALAWRPLGGGWLGEGTDLPLGDAQYAQKRWVQSVLDAIAADLGASRTQVALAWLMKHPAPIVPIVGSARPEHIHRAAAADALDLTREQWYRLYVAARNKPLP